MLAWLRAIHTPHRINGVKFRPPAVTFEPIIEAFAQPVNI